MFTIGRLDIGIRTRGAGTPPVPAAPVSTSAPAITGSPIVGASLSCSTGGWTGFPTPTFTYQWIWADTSANISGATSSTYTPVSGDLGHTLKCAVTATNSQGNATANSNTTAAVAALPANTVAPAVTGSTAVGQTLSTTNGTWSNTPTSYAYQWKWADTGASISGATASTYLLVSGDVGHTIKCTVTATNAAGSASADSNTTGAVTGASSAVFTANFLALSALPTGISLSRATTGTRFNSSGVNVTEAIDAPRFDYAWNGSAWVATGLLIEEQRTNLALQSQTLGTTWTTDGVSVTSDAATGPDGATTADKVIPSAATVAHDIYQPVTTASGSPHTCSVYAKAAGYNFALISADGASVRYGALVNLTTGAIVSNPTLGSPTGTSTKVTDVGNGWYRIAVTMTTDTVASYFGIAPVSSSGDTINGDNNPVFLGDGTSGVLFYGAQLEAGSFATSYIPTTTAAVTRSADIVQLTGAALAALQGSAATAIVEITNGNDQATFGMIADGFPNNTQILSWNLVATTPYTYNPSGGILFGSTTISPLSPMRSASAWDGTGRSISSNGDTVATDSNTQGPLSAGTTLGSRGASGDALNGHIAKMAIYNTRLSDTDLQAKSVVGAAF